MMFLERNLEQLTVVQRQLVEQNSSLKKEVAIAERKLIARNERIQSLESLLQDSQEKLTAANHRYVKGLSYLLDHLGRRDKLLSLREYQVLLLGDSLGTEDHESFAILHTSASLESRYIYINSVNKIQQFRSATYGRQRASRSRQTRLYPRSRIAHKHIFCIRRRRWLSHRKASPRRRRACPRWPCAPCSIESPGPRSRQPG